MPLIIGGYTKYGTLRFTIVFSFVVSGIHVNPMTLHAQNQNNPLVRFFVGRGGIFHPLWTLFHLATPVFRHIFSLAIHVSAHVSDEEEEEEEGAIENS